MEYLDYFPTSQDLSMKVEGSIIRYKGNFVFVENVSKNYCLYIFDPTNKFKGEVKLNEETFKDFDFEAFLIPMFQYKNKCLQFVRQSVKTSKMGVSPRNLSAQLHYNGTSSPIGTNPEFVLSFLCEKPVSLKTKIIEFLAVKENGPYSVPITRNTYLSNGVVSTLFHTNGSPIFYYDKRSIVMCDNNTSNLLQLTKNAKVFSIIENVKNLLLENSHVRG